MASKGKFCPECSSEKLQPDKNKFKCPTCGMIGIDPYLIYKQDPLKPELKRYYIWRDLSIFGFISTLCFISFIYLALTISFSPLTWIMLILSVSFSLVDPIRENLFFNKMKKINPNYGLRITKWQMRSTKSNPSTSFERIVKLNVAELRRNLNLLKIPNNISEKTYNKLLVLIKKLSQRNLLHVKSIELISAYCIYSTCKSNNYDITLEQISESSGASIKEIKDTNNFMVKNKII